MTPVTRALSIGFSPCPNDTFIFYHLVHGLACPDGPALEAAQLADVETLNEWALSSRLDITKLSFHALGHVLEDYALLSAGSALGRGCGPLLVAGPDNAMRDPAGMTVAIPGRLTTAALLLHLFEPGIKKLAVMRFDEIMPCISSGKVDAGVIIHESRFTYEKYGLTLVQDLGAWWEEKTGLPIPLGGIAARRSLGKEVIRAIDRCIRQSIALAFSSPEQCMEYVRRHAQELDDAVIRDHIALYVNTFSLDLGPEGLTAVREFLRLARQAGLLPPSDASLQM